MDQHRMTAFTWGTQSSWTHREQNWKGGDRVLRGGERRRRGSVGRAGKDGNLGWRKASDSAGKCGCINSTRKLLKWYTLYDLTTFVTCVHHIMHFIRCVCILPLFKTSITIQRVVDRILKTFQASSLVLNSLPKHVSTFMRTEWWVCVWRWKCRLL